MKHFKFIIFQSVVFISLVKNTIAQYQETIQSPFEIEKLKLYFNQPVNLQIIYGDRNFNLFNREKRRLAAIEEFDTFEWSCQNRQNQLETIILFNVAEDDFYQFFFENDTLSFYPQNREKNYREKINCVIWVSKFHRNIEISAVDLTLNLINISSSSHIPTTLRIFSQKYINLNCPYSLNNLACVARKNIYLSLSQINYSLIIHARKIYFDASLKEAVDHEIKLICNYLKMVLKLDMKKNNVDLEILKSISGHLRLYNVPKNLNKMPINTKLNLEVNEHCSTILNEPSSSFLGY